MDFLETPTFPKCPSFGFTSEPMYDVTITRRASGHERRNRNWSRPLHRYTATVGPREDADVQEVLEFWHAVGGRAVGFRFNDGNDNKSCRVHEVPSAIDQPLILVAGVSPAVYQLTKRYSAGALYQDREISKPISGTILVADNGVSKLEGVDWTLDYTTGLVSILFVPTGPLTWGGEFDVPVRFDSELPVELMDKRIQSASFSLMELRETEY